MHDGCFLQKKHFLFKSLVYLTVHVVIRLRKYGVHSKE